MKTLPVAVQVYSVREDAEKDFAGTMKKIKEIGYDGVELAGLYGLSPSEIKAAIQEAGLQAVSAHVPFQDLVADMEGVVSQYEEIGVKFIAIPYLMEEDRPGGDKFGDCKGSFRVGKRGREFTCKAASRLGGAVWGGVLFQPCAAGGPPDGGGRNRGNCRELPGRRDSSGRLFLSRYRI